MNCTKCHRTGLIESDFYPSKSTCKQCLSEVNAQAWIDTQEQLSAGPTRLEQYQDQFINNVCR